LFAVIILGFVVALKEIALVAITMGYVLFGVFRHLRRIAAARKRATLPPFPTS